jgi:hypothetical protein
MKSQSSSLLDALWRPGKNIHFFGVHDRKRRHFRNIVVATKAQATDGHIAKLPPDQDQYLACAAYATANGGRTRENTVGAYAFWLDIDCGPDKASTGHGYSSINEALDAVTSFCKRTGLPEPTHVVASGAGVHVYWILDDLASTQQWLAIARKFKALTVVLKLLADPSRTADIASVLRLPDTLNYKYTPPRLVRLIRATDACLDKATVLEAIDAAYSKHFPGAVAAPKVAPIGHAWGATSKPAAETLIVVKAYLGVLDPDIEQPSWYRAGAAIFNSTNGHDLGYQLFDQWSARGKKYKGQFDTNRVWMSFSHDHDKQANFVTLRWMVTEAGHDWLQLASDALADFEALDGEVL